MEKACGPKESCFVNGDKAWGHWGQSLCLHLSEKKTNSGPISICLIDNKSVKENEGEK